MDNYMHRIVEEIMPLVAERYAVSRDHSKNAFGGGSFAGVTALYAAMRFPHVRPHAHLTCVPAQDRVASHVCPRVCMRQRALHALHACVFACLCVCVPERPPCVCLQGVGEGGEG